MAQNTLSTVNPTFWAREAEQSLFVDNKAMAIANTTLRNLVAGEGAQVNRQIINYPAAATYTPGNDLTNRLVVSSQESLSIATWFASMVTIDDTEVRQSVIELASNLSRKMMMNHNNRIEQAVTYEVYNSQWSLDDGNLGGTSGNNASLNTSNIPQVFIAADTKLDAIDAPKAGRTAVVGGHFLGLLKLQQAGRNTIFGDGVNTRGVVTNLFGWDILYSNNLPFHATLAMATNPSNTDTVTIAGVTFTFVTSIGSTAGNVLVGTDANGSQTYLIAAINDTNTAATGQSGTHYVDLSAENRFLIRDKRRITAIKSSTNCVIEGFGDIVVSETLTPAADIWSEQRQDSLFLVSGAIDQIVQIPPKIEVVRSTTQFGDIVRSLLGYGVKTFADGARKMVRVKISAATSDWS